MSREQRSECGDVDWFLRQERVRNLYLKQPGFSACYVRQCAWAPSRGHILRRTIELANIAVRRTGRGTFTRLVEHLTLQYPKLYVVVECVLTDRFWEGLLRRGFIPMKRWEGDGSRNAYLPLRSEVR